MERQNANYYYNVAVICIAVHLDSNILPKDILHYWNIENIEDICPYVIHIYRDGGLEENIEWEFTVTRDCMVEVPIDRGMPCWFEGE